MFREIRGLLSAAEVARARELGAKLQFVDGRASNPANTTKQNQQADQADPRFAESVKLVADALARSRELFEFAFPKRIAPPLLCRYQAGMQYGAHPDAAILRGPTGALRSDLSCTVFISPPESYAGGELAIRLGERTLTFKGKAGDAIVYPSTTLHEVREVTGGVRLVSITFIESLIVDSTARELLFELNEVRALEGFNIAWENRLRLELVSQNLLRRWSQS
ncbi:MAG: Fe2+-dependent dioxygenase [Gammaproteobacteria bacterium]|nr:Fe2+-dependent dioxygenase [Gammaproteobacteria bacterium]